MSIFPIHLISCTKVSMLSNHRMTSYSWEFVDISELMRMLNVCYPIHEFCFLVILFSLIQWVVLFSLFVVWKWSLFAVQFSHFSKFPWHALGISFFVCVMCIQVSILCISILSDFCHAILKQTWLWIFSFALVSSLLSSFWNFFSRTLLFHIPCIF